MTAPEPELGKVTTPSLGYLPGLPGGPVTVGTVRDKAKAKRRPGVSYITEVEVEVDVDEEDLAGAGYHHEDDCPNGPDLGAIPALHHPLDTLAVIASLHRQAHPSQHSDPLMCHEEPCRSIPLDALRGAR